MTWLMLPFITSLLSFFSGNKSKMSCFFRLTKGRDLTEVIGDTDWKNDLSYLMAGCELSGGFSLIHCAVNTIMMAWKKKLNIHSFFMSQKYLTMSGSNQFHPKALIRLREFIRRSVNWFLAPTGAHGVTIFVCMSFGLRQELKKCWSFDVWFKFV